MEISESELEVKNVFLGNSSFSYEIRNMIESLSKNNAPYLISGEKGTGKELFANLVHKFSSSTPFFRTINCLKKNKSELLQRISKVSLIRNESGFFTVYFNRIDAADFDIQREIVAQLDAIRQTGADVRCVFSSENSLEELITEKKFSEELYYRINHIVVNMIPLRERPEDIPPIFDKFFNEAKVRCFKNNLTYSDEVLSDLKNHFFSANCDELLNAVNRAMLVCSENVVTTKDLFENNSFNDVKDSFSIVVNDLQDKSLKNAVDLFKKNYITRILEENGWNQTRTAGVLGIQRTYVIKLMNELGIKRK